MEPEPVTIFTDNQSALVSLAQMTGKSTVVQQCIDSLNKLAKSRSVTIKWIKAHFDHCGNEMADALAKSGTEKALMEWENGANVFCQCDSNFNLLHVVAEYDKLEVIKLLS